MDANFDQHTRAGFLIERYPPGATIDQVRAGAERLTSAIDQLRSTGVAITYVGSVWIPDDDTIFDALVTDSTTTVYDAIGRAGTPVDRINHAYFVTPDTTRGPHPTAASPPSHEAITADSSTPRDDQVPGAVSQRRAVPQPDDPAKGSER
jgi:hypothetical protein